MAIYPTLALQRSDGSTDGYLLATGSFYVTCGVSFTLDSSIDLDDVQNAVLAAQDVSVTVVSPLAVVD
ncbi:MAG: hypothetical protein ACI8PZ_001415 [Myxococcota bacterium]|jgi:hypothetical protein